MFEISASEVGGPESTGTSSVESTGDAHLDAVLERIEAGADQLLDVDLDGLVRLDAPSFGLHAAARRVERLKRRLAAFDTRYVTAIELGDEAVRYGRPNPAALIRDQLKVSPSEAKRRVRLAHACAPGQSFSAEPVPAECPALADAMSAGAVSAEHADVVVKTLAALPAVARKEHGELVEQLLVREATNFDPTLLARLARHTANVVDPDGSLRDQDWQDRNRTASLMANGDGTGTLRAILTAQAFDKLQTVLGALAHPVPAGPDGPDPRDAGQRLHDGLVTLADRALDAGELPASGGTRTTVVVHVTAEQLASQAGLAVSANGTLVPVGPVLATAGDSLIYTLVTNAKRVPLWLGRTTRIATPGQSVALAARDGGCTFPGCDRPPAWCERHHVQEWAAANGRTDIDELALLCGFHHREFTSRGWAVVMIEGHPWWIPPKWIDPEQRPIRNSMHRPFP
jgi:Domain of unknown function (DUF222)